jgi:GNAT superfamily N-acetyltransferase
MKLADLRVEATLLDGSPVTLRAVRPDDKPRFQAGFHRLSAESIYHRFFQAKHELSDDELRYLTELDFQNHVALAATVPEGTGERIIGVGRMVRLGKDPAGDRAEVAFTVADEYQGHGVATLLLQHLSHVARLLGIHRLEAEVQRDNRQMMEVFEHSGLPIHTAIRDQTQHVVLSLG